MAELIDDVERGISSGSTVLDYLIKNGLDRLKAKEAVFRPSNYGRDARKPSARDWSRTPADLSASALPSECKFGPRPLEKLPNTVIQCCGLSLSKATR